MCQALLKVLGAQRECNKDKDPWLFKADGLLRRDR